MSGIINFETNCPWQLYLFSFLHLFGGLAMYLIDISTFFTNQNTPSTPAEELMQRLVAFSMLYVGILYTVITYHNKTTLANITVLTNVAFGCSTAFLASCIFTGNADLGDGLEKSWMHRGDMLTMMILVGVLFSRVIQPGAEWAEKKAVKDGLGINCKTLLLLFSIVTILKFFAYTDFMDPQNLLADGLEMTRLAYWSWNIVAVLIFECGMALIYSILFDDKEGHEIVVMCMAAMTLIAGCSLYSYQRYLTSWLGMNGNGLWIRISVMVGVCIVAVAGGRWGGRREGYTKV